MAKSKLALGLDIGSSSVKLVQLKEAKRGYILEAFASPRSRPRPSVDGALMNSTAIVEAHPRAGVAVQAKNREAAIGVSGHSVIIKRSACEDDPGGARGEHPVEAEQYIPFRRQGVNIDVQILTPPDVTRAPARWTCCWWRRRRT